ncbi:dynein light chain Tctex-type protein 2B-like [Rhopilema esculentum]|uniref:dynein light chain Tctex-type protein 2B-like n=1 Tax=Rhopilema esculentum TaxID=499914 RepID=UPI0031DE6595|eukprot:gene16762-8223_t
MAGDGQENTYMIRPNFRNKFRPVAVKNVIHEVLSEELGGKQYNAEETATWTRAVSDSIKDKLKEMEYDRYKIVVQVVIGEQRGEGVKFAARCLWDSDTDNFAQDIYTNESLFCVAVAYGVFYY